MSNEHDHPCAAVAAIQYALDHQDECPMEFLRSWFHGDFDVIRKEWPDVPDAVFKGADPLNDILMKHGASNVHVESNVPDSRSIKSEIMKPAPFIRDNKGCWVHPSIPPLDEDVQLTDFLESIGFDVKPIFYNDVEEPLFFGQKPTFGNWFPDPPQSRSGADWRLVAIKREIDNKQRRRGPVAIFVTPSEGALSFFRFLRF